jgi:TNF receptor-associated factor 4
MAEAAQKHLDLLVAQTRHQAEYIHRLKAELEKATTSRDGVLIWKVQGVAEKMEEAKGSDGLELVSLPFFTSNCGYKLQASLFLGGNGGGEDTHMSIYIKVLPGDFDSILKWPFKHTVSFTLMDQNPDRNSAVNIVESFIPDPNWPNFSRPSTVEDPDQLGFGFPKFVPHGMLAVRNYIKDDTLFIKIRADANKGVAV